MHGILWRRRAVLEQSVCPAPAPSAWTPYTAFVTNNASTSSSKNMNKKIPARIFAIANEAPAILVKPSNAAINPITRKTNAPFNIDILPFTEAMSKKKAACILSPAAFLRTVPPEVYVMPQKSNDREQNQTAANPSPRNPDTEEREMADDEEFKDDEEFDEDSDGLDEDEDVEEEEE